MPYKIREDVATADVAFEAEGATFEEMCVSAAEATTRIMVDPQTLKEKKTKSFAVKGETPEKLLFNFLNEIIYIKDAELLLFKSFIVKKQGAAALRTAGPPGFPGCGCKNKTPGEARELLPRRRSARSPARRRPRWPRRPIS